MGVPSGADTGFLTGMRGIAALLVFLYHSHGFGLQGAGGPADNFVANGHYGVAIFFVVSAYCLCLVTDTAWLGKRIDWRAFYIRRVFRIVPLYFAMLAVSVAYMFARGTVPPDLLPSLISHLTFFNIVDVAHNNDLWLGEWTIAVEFGFYALFPLVLLVVRRAALWTVPIALVLSTYVLRVVVSLLLWPAHTVSIDQTLVWYFFAFAFGVAAYTIARSYRLERGVAETVCVVFSLCLLWAWLHPSSPGTDVQIALGTAGLIVGCANPHTLLARALRAPILAFLGTISFSIYLLHLTVLSVLPHTSVGTALALAITLGLATLTHRYIEAPFRNWGRALALGNPPAATLAKPAA